MKKTLAILTFLIVTLTLQATTYYVAATGSNNSYAGTISSPWATWWYGMSRLVAGDILYIRQGTYTDMQTIGSGNNFGVHFSSHNGTSGNPITVSAYPGDASPVLDCTALNSSSSNIGIYLENCNYWNFTRLTDRKSVV